MTELTYTKNGDYLIPDLTLSETPEDARPLGKYGRLRRSYLQEHRPGLYSRLVLSEKLFPHLREIDETANRRLEQMMPELAAEAGATVPRRKAKPVVKIVPEDAAAQGAAEPGQPASKRLRKPRRKKEEPEHKELFAFYEQSLF